MGGERRHRSLERAANRMVGHEGQKLTGSLSARCGHRLLPTAAAAAEGRRPFLADLAGACGCPPLALAVALSDPTGEAVTRRSCYLFLPFSLAAFFTVF